MRDKKKVGINKNTRTGAAHQQRAPVTKGKGDTVFHVGAFPTARVDYRSSLVTCRIPSSSLALVEIK